jgi:hypothetical protein
MVLATFSPQIYINTCVQLTSARGKRTMIIFSVIGVGYVCVDMQKRRKNGDCFLHIDQATNL